MGFTSRRGRPKTAEIIKIREEKDLGTKELQERRAKGLTLESIDKCKQKELITDEQYSAALHFRWLYTIRFGAPGVSAIDLTKPCGYELRSNDEMWQSEREREYSMAVEKLRAEGALKIVMNISVFNSIPKFLKRQRVFSEAELKQNIQELSKFRDGLSVLVKLWHRNYAVKTNA